MKMKKFRWILVLVFAFLFIAGLDQAAFAQPGNPDDPEVPITGIEWLLVGGSLFGARKIYQKFRNRD